MKELFEINFIDDLNFEKKKQLTKSKEDQKNMTTFRNRKWRMCNIYE